MEQLKLYFVPRVANKIIVKLSYRSDSPSKQTCIAHEKWRRVLSELASLSDLELAETLPELMPELRFDKPYFKSAKQYAGYTIALHLLGKNLGMDLRKF